MKISWISLDKHNLNTGESIIPQIQSVQGEACMHFV